MSARFHLAFAFFLSAGALLSACDSKNAAGGDGSAGSAGSAGYGGAGAANGGAGGTAGAQGGAGGSVVPPAMCDPAGPLCNNCKDDDGDGKIDYLDPECTGPLDNSEADFSTGIPGDNIDACKQDCFFDGDSGMGNDGCDWNLKCDSANPGGSLAKSCPYDANYKNCPKQQSARCIEFCQSKTPNGCDCFGCCLLGGKAVLLAPTCTLAKIDDPKACPPCTQNDQCVNKCDKCEICLDKPYVDADCPRPDGGVPDGGYGGADGGYDGPEPPPPPSCPEGVVPCGYNGVDPSACPPETVCITGCCQIWVR